MPTPAEWTAIAAGVQAASAVLLIGVTGWYAKTTASMSRATESLASVAQSQLERSVRPFLVVEMQNNLVLTEDMREERVNTGKQVVSYPAPTGKLRLTIANAGTGPATYVYVNARYGQFVLTPYSRIPAIPAGEKFTCLLDISTESRMPATDDATISVRLQYDDMLGTQFTADSRYEQRKQGVYALALFDITPK